MADLIDRQAVLKELPHALWGKEWDEALAKAIIESMPSIDPVKHGKWIPVDEKNDAFDCSECDAMVQRRYNYCPHCGARMERSEILLMRFVRDYLESEVKNGTVQKD